MPNTPPADGAPVPIRIDDRITFADGRMPGYVHSLHRELKNGRPGVRYRVPAGTERMHWAYLTDIATVNGKPTDYAERYPIPPQPHRCTVASDGIDQSVLEQVGHLLGETMGLTASLRRVPVPEVFDPAEEEDLCNGFVGIDVELGFRMYVLPGDEHNVTALYDAFEFWLRREYADVQRQTAPADL